MLAQSMNTQWMPAQCGSRSSHDDLQQNDSKRLRSFFRNFQRSMLALPAKGNILLLGSWGEGVGFSHTEGSASSSINVWCQQVTP